MARLISACRLALTAVLTLALAFVPVSARVAAAEPQGEIWEWALGKDMLTDPTLRDYVNSAPGGPGRVCYGDPTLCQQSPTNPQDILPASGIVKVPSEGFGLVPDEHGKVVSVVLYNDLLQHKYLYQGRLPEGWTWGSNATDLGAVFGAPNMVAGIEQQPYIPIAFTFRSADNRYDLRVEFAATKEAELPGALMREITVTLAPPPPGAPATPTGTPTNSPGPTPAPSVTNPPPNA